MIEPATGIVLRVYPVTETSLIVHWLTHAHGRIATVAKGARRPRSPFSGKLDLFYFCDFNFYRSRRSELHILKEVSVRDTHFVLRTDIVRLQQASYCAALIEQTTETETPVPGIFNLFAGLLVYLCVHPPTMQAVFAFELKLLRELGLEPNPQKVRLSAGARQVLNYLLECDWSELGQLRLTDAQTTELRQFLHGFLIYQFGKLPDGRAAALKPHDKLE